MASLKSKSLASGHAQSPRQIETSGHLKVKIRDLIYSENGIFSIRMMDKRAKP